MMRAFCFLLLWLACFSAGADEPLSPEMAFRPSVHALDGQAVEVRFEIAEGYYLYRDKFRFTAVPDTVVLGAAVFPKGQEKKDENFGQVEVYFQDVAIRLPVERNSSGILPLTLRISSQGCAEAGLCYPPQQRTLSVELPDPSVVSELSPLVQQSAQHDESGRIARLLENESLWWAAACFFGFGLLLSLTPCTFPMIPILSGIIVGSGSGGQNASRSRAFSLSLAYVFGMAVAYAAAGVAAGLSGTLIASALQNVWVLGGFALIFVVLAFSMFGLFELQLPSFLQSRVSEGASRIRGGSLPGVALMGAVSALIVGPCVAAPLAGALLYIGRSGDALLGGSALFCMALGMGVPLLLVGLSAGALLPKAGAWMTVVNRVFGVVLLASALWIVSPLIPLPAQMLGWALLLIVPAIFLHALDSLPPHAKARQRFGKAIGVIMLLLGVAMLVGALSGAKDPLCPLAGLMSSGSGEEHSRVFERVRSLAELENRVAAAGKPVMLDFYADWCVSCKEMERYTFSDARVREKLSGWLLLQADVTANSPEDKELLARFQLFGPPGILFFDASGKEVKGVRVVGFQKADEFLKSLAAARP